MDNTNFCTGCFLVDTDEVYCSNCGHGFVIYIPRAAAEQIIRNASWMGKRLCPAHEDYMIRANAKTMSLEEANTLYPEQLGERIFEFGYRSDTSVTVYTYGDELIDVILTDTVGTNSRHHLYTKFDIKSPLKV